MASEEDLRSLVVQMAAGDRSAFREMYNDQVGRVRRLVKDYGVTSAETRTIVSSTFIEIWWLASFHVGPSEDVEAWLSVVANRRAAEMRLARSMGGAGDSNTRRPWWVDASMDWDRSATRLLRDLLSATSGRIPGPRSPYRR